jgi:hypothetical protein
MSSSSGAGLAIARLHQNTPGTSRGSTQWSPDQDLVLSLKTSTETPPVAQSQECRKPLW